MRTKLSQNAARSEERSILSAQFSAIKWIFGQIDHQTMVNTLTLTKEMLFVLVDSKMSHIGLKRIRHFSQV